MCEELTVYTTLKTLKCIKILSTVQCDSLAVSSSHSGNVTVPGTGRCTTVSCVLSKHQGHRYSGCHQVDISCRK